ncbi:hypothetical protein UVI_02049560 [Ustilaginoidea virens]|nr:hypothetical protein UVI_02049560 [Ustilaginoidea virens]
MLVNHLRNNGAQVAVVAPHNHTNLNTFSPPPSPSVRPADKQPELRVTGYPLPFNPELSIVYPVRNSALYSRTFGDDAPPHLIYLASPASLGFQVLLQLRQQPREEQIPVICNFQTDLSGYCSILFPPLLSHIAVFAFDAVQSYLFRHSSVKTIFYPSRFVQRYLLKNKVQPGKLELLTRGVDTDLFHPSRRSDKLRQQLAPNGQVIFVCVSRIAGEKGFDFLSQVAKTLDRRGLDFTLYIVGGNRNPDVERDVQELFRPLQDQGKVVFAGFKAGQDLATAYASGDVFLHCSVTETFGLVVLESMASGVPVVARDQGGPSDIVQHGKTGLLLPPHNLEAFVTKAAELASDAALAQRLGAHARAAACEATWEKINNKVARRMADTIAEHERRDTGKPTSQPRAPLWNAQQLEPPVRGWLAMSDAVRDAVTRSIIDARLAGGLGVILTFWAVTGCYVFFTECLMRARGLARTG